MLLLSAVLVPAVCLLWFMSAAMRNERYAARERLADAYRAQLSALQTLVEKHWGEVIADLEQIVKTNAPRAAFACAVRSRLVESLVVFDDNGRIVYPSSPLVNPIEPQLESAWAEANQLEYSRKDFSAAAQRYRALATQLTNIDLSARALQAAARCFVQGGQTEFAIQLINDELSSARYRDATDAQGRLIVANVELMALELIADKTSRAFETVARRLEQRLNDYDNPISSPQRRFLMSQVQKFTGDDVRFPMLRAERLAAEVAGRADRPAESTLRRSPLPEVWQVAITDRRALALFNADSLGKLLRPASQTLPANTQVALLPPAAEEPGAFVSMPAGKTLPGWTLALLLNEPKIFDAAARHRTAAYFWAGILIVVAVVILGALATRSMRRRLALARLKNDLVATVSHELKTPLASMRVLIDTLLDSDRLNEQTTREYLQLISGENERLSRLIHNFLTFGRLEQRKDTFELSPCPANQIVDAAVDAVRERFNAPGCTFEVQAESHLPNVLADADALTTALVNLLDNAWKYSDDIKHVVLRATSENGRVVFAVQDNGIGIAARETKRIFESFYQVDQRLSRSSGGCGLGLSIVQSIVSAHEGTVFVTSEAGRGSKFTISIPVTVAANRIRQEAIA